MYLNLKIINCTAGNHFWYLLSIILVIRGNTKITKFHGEHEEKAFKSPSVHCGPLVSVVFPTTRSLSASPLAKTFFLLVVRGMPHENGPSSSMDHSHAT